MKTKREGQFQTLENTDVLSFGKYVVLGSKGMRKRELGKRTVLLMFREPHKFEKKSK